MLLFEQIFKNEEVKYLLSQNNFLYFLNQINPLISSKIELNKISLCPWDDYQKQFLSFIITALNNPNHRQNYPHDNISPKKLKGIYFCLGDDGLDFSIQGSMYYNETDWAANADFDFYVIDQGDFLQYLSGELAPFLQLQPRIILSRNADIEPLSDLLYLFSAFTILKTMEAINNNPYIANAGIAFGYSDGDEVILGRFTNGKFIKNIQLVADGNYETPSSAPAVILKPVAPRGVMWEYLLKNYLNLIATQGLMEQFVSGGEQEAEKISNVLKDQLIVNRCPHCRFLKKTPRARLCLNCGVFSD